MNPKIKPAQPADIPQLAALLDDLFDVELDFTADASRQIKGLELMVAESARSDRQMVAVARDESGQPVGMASGQIVISTAEGAPSVWVEDVVVHAAHRRQGIGKQLVEFMRAWAKARGANRMQLVADRENASANLFYTALGWQSTQLLVRRRSIE
ncbi:MAG: GNAT family N-acetyltransferase [Burkholderiales bacterium]